MTARAIVGAALLAIATLATGCGPNKAERAAQAAINGYFAGDHERAVNLLRPLAETPDQDFVLNNVRLGSAALVQYDLDEAEAAFLRAYEVLNSFGVNSGGRSLGAVLVDEKIRVWRGEPYERAMANFYLGLVYYLRHDYANARAAFENALFKLRDYADDPKKAQADDYREVESNFIPAMIMLGRAWQRLGRDDLARANFSRVAELRPDLAALADHETHARSNLLLVVDFGYGPRKVTNEDGSIVGFAPTPDEEGMIPRPTIWIDGQRIDIEDINDPPMDLLVTAQDRRWQSIDTIRAVKSGLGTGLIAGGIGYGMYKDTRRGTRGMSSEDAGVMAALIGAGLLLKATSQADVRQWEMLPRTVFILPLEVEPGTHDITVEFPNVPGVRQTWRGIIVPEHGEATYYMRMQRWNSGPFEWPPPAMAQVEPAPAAP